MNKINHLISNFSSVRLLLIGDLMLDRFIYGTVERISPEGPVPVLKVIRKTEMLGGVGNVAANAAAMGAQVTLIATIGVDQDAQSIQSMMKAQCRSNGESLWISQTRPTTVKTRYIAQGQQLLRVDEEEASDLSPTEEADILIKVKAVIKECDAVILSDYGKGLLTPSVIQAVISLAKDNKKPVIVDPKKKDFSVYRGATIITPNLKELEQATGRSGLKTDQQIEEAAQTIIQDCGIETVMVTRSEDGISILSATQAHPIHVKTKAQDVYDVSGAGDTVVAALGCVLAAGGSLTEAAGLCNLAGGIAVSRLGTAIVSQQDLQNSLPQQDESTRTGQTIAPLFTRDAARAQIAAWQAQGLSVGFTNGCFDILHYGHVQYLARAREKCDRLVVGLNHDRSVRILKGQSRPINDEAARAVVIGALASVDLVVLFGADQKGEDNTPCALLDVLRPDLFMKGGDYTLDQLPEVRLVQSYGGRVEIMPLYEGYSTTAIVQKTSGEKG